jgi:hypothetical protein
MSAPENINIPAGVIFDRIIFVPPLPTVLDGLFYPHYGSRRSPTWVEVGRWVRRGQSLASYFAQWTFSSVTCPVLSPVDGYLLAVTAYGYGKGYDWERPRPVTLANNAYILLVPRQEGIPETDDHCLSDLFEAISRKRKKLFSDSYLNSHLKEWANGDTFDRFRESQRNRKILKSSLNDCWPVVRPIDGSFNDGWMFFHRLERALRSHPKAFSDLTKAAYTNGKLAMFDQRFHPQHGIYPVAKEREMIWKKYRDRIEEYMGPDELVEDIRPTITDENQDLYTYCHFGVMLEP